MVKYRPLMCLGLVAGGMIGLYLRIDFSGWLVFAGLMGFLFE